MNIYPYCANIANYLGMSWINSQSFAGQKPQDMGITLADPMKPGQQNFRTLRMNNQFIGGSNDYDVSSPDVLELF
jgi:hypothetical protein